MDLVEDSTTEGGLDGGGIMSSYQNMSHSFDSRYGLCNISRYAGVPLCANRTFGVEEFRPDFSHGFAMQRIISIVVRIFDFYSYWLYNFYRDLFQINSTKS